MVTLGQLADITGSGRRYRIFKGSQEIFRGWLFLLTEHDTERWNEIKDAEIKKFICHLEVTHKRWQELGLRGPIEPDEAAEYPYADLEQKLYYTVTI